MKSYVIIAAAIVVGLVIALAAFKVRDAKALQVNEITNPAAYSGTITVTGIMAGMSDFDKNVFGLGDIKESQCKKGCEKIFIPIRFMGEKPAVGDEIRVTGSFVKLEKGYLFQAKDLSVVKKQKLQRQSKAARPLELAPA